MNLAPFYASGGILIQPVPFRLRVLKALTVLFEDINPDNGYRHDLRGKVFRGRVRYSDDDPMTMISILEAPIPQEPMAAKGPKSASSGMWELLIQGFCDDDKRHPSDPAHKLMAEVKTALVRTKVIQNGNNILGMSARVMEMFIGQGTVRPADEPTTEAFFWLTVSLLIAEDLENPYA
jgi:hypothetical protein